MKVINVGIIHPSALRRHQWILSVVSQADVLAATAIEANASNLRMKEDMSNDLGTAPSGQ
jgi:hypothetical protein